MGGNENDFTGIGGNGNSKSFPHTSITVSDLQTSSRGFDSRPFYCRVTTLGKLSHKHASVSKQ